MKTATRLWTLALILSGPISANATIVEPPAPKSQAAQQKQWVWLASQGVWGFGYKIQQGQHRGLWRIDPDSKCAPSSSDPYGFVEVLNRYRAQAGLGPVSYDSELTTWAQQNNHVQSARGIGHHVNPNCFQNCGWNYDSAEGVADGWMNSRGHRANMLHPSISRIGIAYGPGPYWTMNAQ
jgi:hypothetical protein